MTDNSNNETRANRKDEHIKYFIENNYQASNGFEDICLQNNSLPELNFKDICTDTIFLKKIVSFPLIINAMTGGTAYTEGINQQLAELAKKYNIPIAVGSQTIALHNSEARKGFESVRRINHKGVVIANLSALSALSDVSSAVEMLQADAIQLHLNVPQEMCMKEGDRSFKGTLDNIQQIAVKLKLPVIVKETGFGMSYEAARMLYGANIRIIDISGKGGTNFIAIENSRNIDSDCSFLMDWGIPTALSLLECRKVSKGMQIICSGGITKSQEIIKALVMGGDMVGISGAILRELLTHGYDKTDKLIERFIYEVKVLMLLLGAKKIEELKTKQFLLKGEIKELFKSKFM